MIFHFLLLCPDEENTTEHTPTHHMLQPPQAVFPACICAAVLPIVHLMEDGEVREDGVAGRSLHAISDPTQNTQLLKKLLYHPDLCPPCGWTLGLLFNGLSGLPYILYLHVHILPPMFPQ